MKSLKMYSRNYFRFSKLCFEDFSSNKKKKVVQRHICDPQLYTHKYTYNETFLCAKSNHIYNVHASWLGIYIMYIPYFIYHSNMFRKCVTLFFGMLLHMYVLYIACRCNIMYIGSIPRVSSIFGRVENIQTEHNRNPCFLQW